MKVGDLVRNQGTCIGIVLEIVKIGNDSYKARCAWVNNHTMCWSRRFYLEVISESR